MGEAANPIDALVNAVAERLAGRVTEVVTERLEIATAEVLRVKDVAELMRCSPAFVRKLAQAGKIPVHHLGDEWRFMRSELVPWLAENKTWSQDDGDEP